ncbi:hypothetical protein NIES4075_69970 [Tolypothrix sp. NIES-4075]|nr:hypothetical protein NIES4075_69970 [Tolypothrix sp. NIES-4075]
MVYQNKEIFENTSLTTILDAALPQPHPTNKEIFENTSLTTLLKMTLFEKLQILNNIYVIYPRLQEILAAIEYCHHFSSGKAEPECMFLSGNTGVGKTTIYLVFKCCDRVIANFSTCP